jgi:hypothetical protein
MAMSDLEKEQRCRQILRTVTSEALQAQPANLWIYPDPNEEPVPEEPAKGAKDPKAAKGAAPVEEVTPLEAGADPDAGGLFLSHVWGEPDCWTELFGAGQFSAAKNLQVASSLQRAALRGDLLPQGRDARVWVDCASLPDPVLPFDHPLEELTLGTYAMPVQHLKALLPKVEAGDLDKSGYTVLHLNEEGHRFEGTMNLRKWDADGRPLERTTPMTVEWEIPPGWYHFRSAKVIPEDRVSPEEASNKAEFRPFAEQMRKWCAQLRLRDEVWVEFTLGSIRAECMLLAETMLALHGGLLSVMTWNYMDRLWPFVEWTVYCARRGPDRVQLAADHFTGAALVEYHRAIRRLSVEKAGCRDPRDRDLLLGMLKRIFKCDTKYVTESYNTLTITVDNRPTRSAGLMEAKKIALTDWTAVERYARATAIAVFAHEAADVATRKPAAADENGWAALAGELGLLELEAVLKKCKPFDWDELAATKPPEDRDACFDALVEDWWQGKVLPVLEDERKMAMR